MIDFINRIMLVSLSMVIFKILHSHEAADKHAVAFDQPKDKTIYPMFKRFNILYN